MRISIISSSFFVHRHAVIGHNFWKAQLLCITVLLFSCAKVKTDSNLPVLNTLKSANSSIRLIALAGPNQVKAIIAGVTYNLTPNLQGAPYPCKGGFLTYNYVVVNYNPVPVTVPYKLLDQGGNAHIHLISTLPTGATVTSDTVLKDAPSNPTDYYIFPVSRIFADPNYNFIGVPRSTTPPAGVSSIKIRLVNLSSPVDTFNLTGPLTLTYMDGTPVSSVTSGVPEGVSSVYTEIPYGTYHFRLFTQTGLELSETLLPTPSNSASSIHSFQPGGIYTIFVNTNNIFEYGSCGTDNSPPVGPPMRHVSNNSFTIIADIPPPINVSYGKVQFVNTIPGNSCSFSLDNFTIGSSVGYKGISSYRAISVGDYSMQLQDDQGQTLARQNITINPDDNFTAWAYVKNGQPALAISSNDLTNPNAGQKVRFMNCSVNLPYITMTHNGQLIPVINPSTGSFFYPDINDTTSAADATQNLARGVPATHQPFTLLIGSTAAAPGTTTSYPIVVNQSDAGPPPFVPGITLPSVKPLYSSDFIFNPSSYQPGSLIPFTGEQGVYTVALTGFVDNTVSGHPRPDTLLIVKHFN